MFVNALILVAAIIIIILLVKIYTRLETSVARAIDINTDKITKALEGNWLMMGQVKIALDDLSRDHSQDFASAKDLESLLTDTISFLNDFAAQFDSRPGHLTAQPGFGVPKQQPLHEKSHALLEKVLALQKKGGAP